jgi:hypothetical protein
MGGNTEVSDDLSQLLIRRPKAWLARRIAHVQFADSRTAYEDLDDESKDKIKDWVLWHSQHHSRRVASPGEPLLEEKRVSRCEG